MGPENRPLDLEWLEDFVALAEMGSFSRAADLRAIAQPAFSRHIRSLEDWVGVDLIDRGAHPVSLNDAGRKFLPLVRDVLASLEAARIKARLALDPSAPDLRIAITHALSITFFPRWLGAMEAKIRHGPVQTFSDHLRGCEDLMAHRHVQFVLCYGHPEMRGRLDDAGYPVVRLGSELVLPVAAPHATGGPLFEIGRSAPLPILDYSDASGVGRIVHAQLRAPLSRLAPSNASVMFTAHNALLLKSMVLAGRGVAWLPESLVADELAKGAVVPAGDDPWRVQVEIRLYRQNADMAPAAEALWRAVKE